MFKITYKFGGSKEGNKTNRIPISYSSLRQTGNQSIVAEIPDKNAQIVIDKLLSDPNVNPYQSKNNRDANIINNEK